MIELGRPFSLIPNHIFAGTYLTIEVKLIRTKFQWLNRKVGSILELS